MVAVKEPGLLVIGASVEPSGKVGSVHLLGLHSFAHADCFGGGHGHHGAPDIEWEDNMVLHNRMTTPRNMFWKLVDRYPKAERAKGFLEGVTAAGQLGLVGEGPDDDSDVD